MVVNTIVPCVVKQTQTVSHLFLLHTNHVPPFLAAQKMMSRLCYLARAVFAKKHSHTTMHIFFVL